MFAIGGAGAWVMDLDRFKDAQNEIVGGYASALRELRAGGKRTHWIWYNLPQLEGLGESADARYYALTDVTEAIAYLNDPLLRTRLLTLSEAVVRQLAEGLSLRLLMNSSSDVRKLVSSMTLFGALAERFVAPAADGSTVALGRCAATILTAGRAEGFPPCAATLARLESE